MGFYFTIDLTDVPHVLTKHEDIIITDEHTGENKIFPGITTAVIYDRVFIVSFDGKQAQCHCSYGGDLQNEVMQWANKHKMQLIRDDVN